ncbi:MAG: hypothetical protein V4726_03790 [Verrucomicrobiota bacterium]
MKKMLRFLVLPCACFALSWAAAHLVRILAEVGDSNVPSRQAAVRPVLPPKNPPGGGGAAASVSGTERRRILRETFDKSPPGKRAALWAAFADKAGREDLEKLAREPKTLPGRLAEEELAVRTGRAAGSPGAFAALAAQDPEAAWRQVRDTGQSPAAAAVLRILALRDPQDALRRWRQMPLRPALRPLSADEALFQGRVAVTHTALGSLFASWARRDPIGAEVAVDSLPAKLRLGARNEIAMAWAYHDGPAALRYVSRHAAESGTQPWRMDVMLLSALNRWPKETAALLAGDSLLAGGTVEWITPRAVPGLWYLADPDGCLAWFKAADKGPADLLRVRAVLRDPAAAARLLRETSLAEDQNAGKIISGLALRDREAGLALAEEFHARAEVDPALIQSDATAAPAAALESWLAALRGGHKAEEALKSLGWTEETGRRISAFARAKLPDQARELENLLADAASLPAAGPAADPASTGASVAAADRASAPGYALVPAQAEAPAGAPASARAETPDPGSYHFAVPGPGRPEIWTGARRREFSTEPAAAARSLLESGAPLQEWDAWNVVSLWAPHDPAAARDWLAQLPEGRARDQGGLALAGALADRGPAEALTLLTSLNKDRSPPPERDAARIWTESVQRLLLTGGDWQTWLQHRPPGADSRSDKPMAEILASEATLLETLRHLRTP